MADLAELMSELAAICKHARAESHKRGESVVCDCSARREKMQTHICVSTVYFGTGHSGDDSYVDSSRMSGCPYKQL